MTAFKLSGLEEMRAKIRALADAAPKEFGRALREEVDTVTAEAKAQTPVATGALRETVRAEGPVYEGDKISAAVGAGEGLDYAVKVHEDLDAQHAVGTNAKFVEQPLMESAPDVLARVAKRMNLSRR